MEIPIVADYRFYRLRNNKERTQRQGPSVANEVWSGEGVCSADARTLPVDITVQIFKATPRLFMLKPTACFPRPLGGDGARGSLDPPRRSAAHTFKNYSASEDPRTCSKYLMTPQETSRECVLFYII
jgi:hypothetical protein